MQPRWVRILRTSPRASRTAEWPPTWLHHATYVIIQS